MQAHLLPPSVKYLTVVLVLVFLAQQTHSQCCLTLDGQSCLRCPPGFHIFMGNCYSNIMGCQQYSSSTSCIVCMAGYRFEPRGRTCVKESVTNYSMPNDNFMELPPFTFKQFPIDKLYQALDRKFRSDGQGIVFVDLLRVYVRKYNTSFPITPPNIDQDDVYFRFIISTESGLLQISTFYRPSNDILNYELLFKMLEANNFPKTNEEIFINFSEDQNKNAVQDGLVGRYSQFSPAQILDTYRSSYMINSSSTLLNYRVFLIQPNFGLSQVNISITSKYQPLLRRVPLSEIQPIAQLIKNRSAELRNSKVVGATAFEGVFNITFVDAGNISSYITFEIINGVVVVEDRYYGRTGRFIKGGITENLENKVRSGNLNGGEVIVGKSIVSVNATSVSSPLLKILEIRLPQKINSYYKNGEITYKYLSSDLRFFKYLDRTELVSSTIYDGFRNLTRQFYPNDFNSIFLKSQRAEGAIAQNNTKFVMEVTHKSQNYRHFVFSVDKKNLQMEYIRTFTINFANAMTIPLTIANGTNFTDRLSVDLRKLLDKTTSSDPFYVKEARLIIYRKSQFQSRVIANSPVIKTFTIEQFKYYLSPQLNKSYEYIEYRFEFDKQSGGLLESMTTIYDIEQFTQDVSQIEQSEVRKQIIELVYNNQNSNIKIQRLFKSIPRQNIFRATYILNNFRITYQIDTTFEYYPFQVSMQPLSPANYPLVFNRTEFWRALADVDYRDISLSREFINRNPIERQLSVKEIKEILLDYLFVFRDNLLNSDIIVRDLFTIYQTVDSYLIEFREKFGVGKTQPRFFSIETTRSRASIAPSNQTVQISSSQALQTPPAIIQFIFRCKVKVKNDSSPPPISTSLNNLLQLINKSGALPLFYTSIPTYQLRNYRSLGPATPISPANLNLMMNQPESSPFKQIFVQGEKFLTPVFQRTVNNDSNLVILNFQHAYWKSVSFLVSLKQAMPLEMTYDNLGYTYDSYSSTLILQLQLVNEAFLFLDSVINKQLKRTNYTEDGKIKRSVTVNDLFYWRAKRLSNAYIFDFLVEFNTVSIFVGVLVVPPSSLDFSANANSNSNLTTDLKITQLLLYDTADAAETSAVRKVQETMSTSEFKEAYAAFLKSNQGQSLINTALTNGFSITKIVTNPAQPNPNLPTTYTITLETPISSTLLSFTYNRQTQKILSTSTSQQPSSSNCLRVNSNKICVECASGYLLGRKDGKCYRSVQNCQLQTKMRCILCRPIFYLVGGNCV